MNTQSRNSSLSDLKESTLYCDVLFIRKMITWTESSKNSWIMQSSCSSVFEDSNLFICKQVLDDM